MKTIARSRNSLMKSLMVAGGLLGLYYLQKNRSGGRSFFNRAKDVVRREVKGSRSRKVEAPHQTSTMDNIDLDRASPI